jgi:organic hydroperoxide reductase OsmC/OhrA
MAAIAPFPHRYAVALEDGNLVAEPRPRIPAGAPPQFGGTDRVWSPEELLVGAVLLCLKTTFDAYALREALEVLDWRGTGTGVLAKSPTGPAFTSVELHVQLNVKPGNEERARQLLETAERHCIISRAIKAPVVLDAAVTAVAPEPTQ